MDGTEPRIAGAFFCRRISLIKTRWVRLKKNINNHLHEDKRGKIMRVTLTVCVLLFSLVTKYGFSQTLVNSSEHELAIRQVVLQYLETRRQNDVSALSSLFTEDVDQVTSSGELRAGREAVTQGTLATSDRTGGERSITIQRIRFLTPDTAIADGPYDIVNRRDGPDRHYHTTIILVLENGAWKIAGIRNMEPR